MNIVRRHPGFKLIAAMALLVGVFVVQACGDPEPPPSRTVPEGQAALGADLLRSHGCINCHTVPGIQGANGMVGPPLISFSRRTLIAGAVPNRTENLLTWIQNPQAIEPGTAMPTLGVSEAEARHIAAYLYALE